MLAYAGVLRLQRWRITACMRGNILYGLIYSGVLQSAQFFLFRWLFWRTPGTLKVVKSSTPMIKGGLDLAILEYAEYARTAI